MGAADVTEQSPDATTTDQRPPSSDQRTSAPSALAEDRRYIFMVVHTVSNRYSGGGVMRATQYWMEGWRTQNLTPTLHVVPARGAGPVWLSPFVLMVCLARLFAGAVTGRVALVHINLSARGSTWRKLPIVALARLLGVPVILHLRAPDYPEFFAGLPAIGQRTLRWMFQSADLVILLGTRWRDYVMEALGVAPQRARVLHHAVPDPLPDGEVAAPRSGPPQICFLGELGVRKGVPDLLEALADPAVTAYPYRAVIAGNGDLDYYRAMAERLGIADRVSFPGWVQGPAVRALFSASDIFVLPSQAEGLSIATLEAMGYGQAIVTTPVGAQDEVIIDGETGLLVPVGDVGALAACLARLLAEPDLRYRLGHAARRSFLQNFELGPFVLRLNEIYRNVFAGRSHGPRGWVVTLSRGHARLSRRAPPPGNAAVPGTLLTLLVSVSIVIMLGMSDHLMTALGISYALEGGGLLEKLHPSTYLIFFAFLLLCFSAGDPVRTLLRLAAARPAYMFYFFAMSATSFYLVLLQGTAGLAFFVDSFIRPVPFVLILVLLEPKWRYRIFLVVVAFVVANCCIGMFEVFTRARLIPFTIGGLPVIEQHFRATALMGHPLNNALITGITLIFAAIHVRNPAARVVAMLIMILGLFAFGGRTALTVALLTVVALTFFYAARDLWRGRFSLVRGMAFLGIGFILPLVVSAAVLTTDLGDRIQQSYEWDASAQARLKSLDFITLLSPEELLYGVSAARFRQLNDTVANVNTVENFWIVLIARFGLIAFVMFAIGLLAFLYRLMKEGDVTVKAGVVAFLLMASANNSLSSKNPSLAVLVVLVLGAAGRVTSPVRAGQVRSPVATGRGPASAGGRRPPGSTAVPGGRPR